MGKTRKGVRTSIIWTLPKDEFEKIVKSASSIAGILRYFGYVATSATYKMVKERCHEDNIDFSHIPLGAGSNKGKKFISKISFPLEQVMVENSTYNRGNLKKRLLKDNLLENKCAICGLLPKWNDKTLVLVLDHINGINNDNRKGNLRLLCPNCNSQTDTFTGKRKRIIKNCSKCGKRVTRNAKMCQKCFSYKNALGQRKVKNRPSQETLQQEIKEINFCSLGKKYGVSDNTIRKWCKSYGINTKIYGKGYWQKKFAGKI